MQNPGSETSTEKIPFNIRGIRKNAANFRKLMLMFPFIHPAMLHSVIVEHMFNWDDIIQVLFRKHKTASNNYWQSVNEQRQAEEALHESCVQRMWNKTYEMEIQENMTRQVNIGINPTDQGFPQQISWTLQDGNRWVIVQNQSENWMNGEQKGQECVVQNVQNYQTVAQTGERDWFGVCIDVPEQLQFTQPIAVSNQWTTFAQNGDWNWMNSGQMDQVVIRDQTHVSFSVDVPVTQPNEVNNKKSNNRTRKYMGKSIKEIQKEIQELHRRIKMDIVKRNLLPRKGNIKNQKLKKTAKKPTNARKISRTDKNKIETKLKEERAQDVPLALLSRKGKANSKTSLKTSKKKTDAKQNSCVK